MNSDSVGYVSNGNSSGNGSSKQPNCDKWCQQRQRENQERLELEEQLNYVKMLNRGVEINVDSKKDILTEMKTGGVELKTGVLQWDGVLKKGDKYIIYTDTTADYNAALKIVKANYWTNVEVDLNREYKYLTALSMNEAKNQGKVSQAEMVTISSRAENRGLSVLYYKDLFDQNLITKSEWKLLNVMDKVESGATATEIIGPIVGAAATYKAGQRGLLDQGDSGKNSTESSSKKYDSVDEYLETTNYRNSTKGPANIYVKTGGRNAALDDLTRLGIVDIVVRENGTITGKLNGLDVNLHQSSKEALNSWTIEIKVSKNKIMKIRYE